MTGYGSAGGSYGNGSLFVELRSVNHRYCDVFVKLPRKLGSLEDVCRKQVQARFARGRFELNVSIQRSKTRAKRYTLDIEGAETYVRLFKQLKKKLHLSGEIDIALLTKFPELIGVSESEEPVDLIENKLQKTLGRAISILEKMRRYEGRMLAADLTHQLQFLSKSLSWMKDRETKALASYHKRLGKRVADLLEGIKADPLRLAQEGAILAERSDISEERSRLKAHVEQFRATLRKEGAVGRRLDFLLQEMHREVNTLGSKSSDIGISMQVVEMKSALEKMREQVQNIE